MDFKECAIKIMEKVTQVEGLADDTEMDLFDAGLLDSLAIISIIIDIEARFGKAFQPTDFVRDDIATVDNFSKCLERLIG